MSDPKEGWGDPTPRSSHYYRGGMSLCGRRGFYTGPLQADDGLLEAADADCRECFRLLRKEIVSGKSKK